MSLRQPGASTLFPQGQARQGYGFFWGVYANAVTLPNAAGNMLSIAQFFLEAGDVAYVTGVGPYYCTSPGTAGGSDATWSSGIGPTGPVGPAGPAGATGPAGPANYSFQASNTGTAPLVIGAVYLTAAQVIAATSHALLGTGGGGTATMQLRRQGTGVLLAGASWSVVGALANVALAGAVVVAATDWYTIELLGSAADTVSLAYGLQVL